MEKIISGIQQIGIGLPNVEGIWPWYRKFFGLDIKIFQEEAEAPLMKKYTGDKVQLRDATLALNLQSGGGFEMWEYKSKGTDKADFDIKLGDLGIYITKIKSRNVKDAFEYFSNEGADLVSGLETDPGGKLHFYVRDPEGNIFEVVEGYDWLFRSKSVTGGVFGAVLGVSDIEASLELYKDILGYEKVLYDVEGIQSDYQNLSGGKARVRRVLLASNKPKGPFSKLLGPSQIELVQLLDSKGKKIFQGRFWGDAGFIHMCFDVKNMDALKKECNEKGFSFTVDSEDTFNMSDAGGRFSYIEDPDGALIEFVETHKIPMMKRLGWYLDLRKRDPEKPLPLWILRAMSFNRVKD